MLGNTACFLSRPDDLCQPGHDGNVVSKLVDDFLLCPVYFLEKGGGRWVGIYTVAVVLAMLTKPVMYVFAIPHLFILGIWAWKTKKNALFAWAVLPLLIVLLYSGFNHQRTGYFHFSSIQTLSLYNYTTRALITHEQGADAAEQWVDSVIMLMERQSTYAQQQDVLQSASRDAILKAPVAYMTLHLKGVVNFFLDPGRFDLYHFFDWKAPEKGLLAGFSEKGYRGVWDFFRSQPVGIMLLLGIILAVNLLKAVALILFVTRRELPLAAKIIPLIFVFYLAILTGVSGASRFAVPLFPLMLVISGYVCTSLGMRWKGKREEVIKTDN